MSHYAQIVTDEHVSQTEVITQIHEQIQDLRLDRYIERCDGLVAHQELRLHRQSASNADTRALATRELMRIALHIRGI